MLLVALVLAGPAAACPTQAFLDQLAEGRGGNVPVSPLLQQICQPDSAWALCGATTLRDLRRRVARDLATTAARTPVARAVVEAALGEADPHQLARVMAQGPAPLEAALADPCAVAEGRLEGPIAEAGRAILASPTGALGEALQRAQEAQTRWLEARDDRALHAAALRALAELAGAALVQVGAEATLPPTLVTALSERDLSALAGEDETLALALRWLQAPDAAARRRLLRNEVLDLPLWASPILFDAFIGLGLLETEKIEPSLTVDVSGGYQTPGWGVIARATHLDYAVKLELLTRETTRNMARVEGWYTFGRRAWRFEARALFGGGAFATDMKLDDKPFGEESSAIIRGSAMAGLRYHGLRFAGGLWAGGGGQSETYSNRIEGPRGDPFTTDASKTSGNVEGRLRLQYALWPDKLALRARLDVEQFSLTSTREDSRTGEDTNQQSQLELDARLYLDIEAIRIWDLVPGVSGGLRYVRVSADEVQETSVPMFTFGFRTEVF